MRKQLTCRDVGFDCSYQVEADTEQEILEAAALHARDVHGVTDVPPEVVAQIRAAIQDVRDPARSTPSP